MKGKIVSLVLAFSMMLSWTAVRAEDADTQIAGDSYVEYHTLVDALKINEGIEKHPQDTLTRGEFTAMSVRLVGADNVAFEKVYEDVSDATAFAPEISAAKKLGISNGVSSTHFAPDSNITYSQAVKMIVSALGLDKPASVGGGYPTGYYMVARNLDILADVNYANDKSLTYEDAITLMYNALLSHYVDVDRVKVDSPDSILYYKESSELVITKFFGYYAEDGVVWSAGKSSMHLEEGKEGIIEIDGTNYTYFGDDIQSYLGLKVKVIYDKYFKAIAIITSSSNKVYTLLKNDIKEYTGSWISYYTEDNRVKKYNFDKGYSKLRNWRATTESGFNFTDGKIILIDNNSDSKIDVAHIQSARTIFVSAVAGNQVYDKNGAPGAVIEDVISVKSGNYTTFITTDELVPGMLLLVYTDNNGNVSYAQAGYNIMHGVVIDSVDKDSVVIEGISYEKSQYFKKYYGSKEIEPGSRITAYFDDEGKLAAVEKFSGTGIGGMNYGFLLGAKFAGSFGEAKLNILTADNEKKTFYLRDKIILDGEGVSKTSSELAQALINPATGRAKYMVIKYSVTEDDMITRIDTAEIRTQQKFEDKYAESDWSIDNSLTMFVQKGKAMYRGTQNLFPYCTYNNPVVFEVPKELANHPDELYEDKLFSVRQKGFTDNDKVTVDLYDYDASFSPAVIVNYASAGSGISPMSVYMYSPLGFVKNVTRALDSEGEDTYAVTLIEGGVEKKYMISSSILPYFEEMDMIPEKADLMQFETDGLGDIAGINLIKYNKETGLFNVDYSKTGDTILSQNTFITGKMYEVSSSHIAFKATTKPAAFSGVDHGDDIIFKASSAQKYVVYDSETDEVRVGTSADVRTIYSAGEDASSNVIMYLSWSNPQIIGVYN